MRVVIGKREIFAAEGEDVVFGLGEREGRQSARLAIEHRPDGIDLVDIDVSVGEAVDVFICLGAGDMGNRQCQCGVLDEVLRQTDRHIAGTLDHVERELVLDDADMHPTVAWADDDLLGQADAPHHVLRDPRCDEMRTQMRAFLDLLDDAFDLIVRLAFAGWEVMEGRAVRARSEVTFFQASFRALLLGHPETPPIAAKLLKLFLRTRAIDETQDLSDGLLPDGDRKRLGTLGPDFFQ